MAMTVQEKQWQAEDDARTLMRSEEINGDSKRLASAKAALKKLADDRKKEAIAIQKAAEKLGVSVADVKASMKK